MKNRILITGGAGYIGSSVSNFLIDKGLSVTIIDNLVTGNKKFIPKKAHFEKCDIDNEKEISRILTERNYDLVIHFAGLIRVDESVKKPDKYFLYNYTKAKKFFDICLKFGLNNIILSSTASVYEDKKKKPISERDKTNPKNPYAKSKLKTETYLVKKSKNNKIDYTILRYFNVAGTEAKMRSGLASKFSTHLIKVACEVATKKRNMLVINGNNYNTHDGTTIRDYIHISDLAEIHLLSLRDLLKNKRSNIYNCGYGKGYSVRDVIDCLNSIIKKKIPVKIGKRRLKDSEYLVANTKKFNDYFKWKPKFNNLRTIIKSSLKWEKKLNK